MQCPQCHEVVQADWSVCPKCQTSLRSHLNPYAAPVESGQASRQPAKGGDATGGIIPYNNPKALIAYYLGIASGLPLIGLPFGVAAFFLGILGLRDRKRNPVIKGSAHAWVGIGCGGLFSLLWLLLIVTLILGAAGF